MKRQCLGVSWRRSRMLGIDNVMCVPSIVSPRTRATRQLFMGRLSPVQLASTVLHAPPCSTVSAWVCCSRSLLPLSHLSYVPSHLSPCLRSVASLSASSRFLPVSPCLAARFPRLSWVPDLLSEGLRSYRRRRVAGECMRIRSPNT